MTLAEIFLLLLIVGWYGMRLESEATGRPPDANPEALRKELEEVKTALKEAEDARRKAEIQLAEYERILKWLQQELGFPGPPVDLEAVKRALAERDRGVRDEARRGKPACSTSNVLAQVVTDGDTITLTVLDQFEFQDRTFQKGLKLDTEPGIETFLGTVQAYYVRRLAEMRDCAFDYRLNWRTDRDYRVGRQRFERYFYPATLTQLSE